MNTQDFGRLIAAVNRLKVAVTTLTGSDISGSGTPGTLPMFSAAQTIGDSFISQSLGSLSASTITFAPTSVMTGNSSAFVFTRPNNTGQTAGANVPGFLYNGGSIEFATGAIATQYSVSLTTATYTAVGASVITNAYGLFVAAPTASTNITITNNWAIGTSGYVLVNADTATIKLQSLVGGTTNAAIYMNAATPSSTNYTIRTNTTDTYFNAQGSITSNLHLLVAGTDRLTINGATANTNRFLFSPATITSNTASTEIPGIVYDNYTISLNTGALTTQRFYYIKSPTLAFGGASVATNVYGLYVEAATAGTNATITNNYALGSAGRFIVTEGTSQIRVGEISASVPGIWFTTAATSTSNYALQGDNTDTYINAPTSSFRIRVANADKATCSTTGWAFTQGVAITGAVTAFTFTNPANTGQTNLTEISSFKYNGGSRAWAAGIGTLATQREVYISTTTYTQATNALTITNAYGMYVEAPTASTNVTITNNFALGLSGSLSMVTGRVLENQGADVASLAGAIALGTDGNLFEITGTNAITLISNIGWKNGSKATLMFTSTATLTHGTATSGTDITLLLAGAANFSASANDTITLCLGEIGGTQAWREISRAVI